MIRFLIPLISIALFFMEPIFGLFSPLHLNGQFYFIVPRFLIMFLIFVAVYYDLKRAVYYGLFFGLLYDVFFIDIIGLYSFLYPAILVSAGYVVKSIHRHLVVTTVMTLVLTALFEFVLYQFFKFISLVSMPLDVFLDTRLLPTMIANSLFLFVLGWVFKLVIDARLIEREQNPRLS